MNELWAEADDIVSKALDGKSTYLIHPDAFAAPTESLIRGKEFFFYTPSQHVADSTSVLHAIRNPLPASYNQTTYDNIAAGASLGYADPVNKWVLSDTGLGLDFSLKAHTRDVGGETHFLWDRSQPNPERRWKFCTAEILIGDCAGNQFEFANEWDKFNALKIHNLGSDQIEVFFGTQANHVYSITIPAYSQRCVRRDSVTGEYNSSYKYFFQCNTGDPRFLHFKSHSGFVPDSMRANNITNASFLYNILEVVGQRADTLTGATRITFDAHTHNDIGDEYKTAGYVPQIANSTLVGDLIFHNGNLSFFRAATTSSEPETGSISFDGFGNLLGALNDAGLTGSIENSDDRARVSKSTDHQVFYIWQQSTNLLTWNDSPRVLNVGSSGGATTVLETNIYETYPQLDPVDGIAFDVTKTVNAGLTTVADYIGKYQTALTGVAETSSESIKLTTEGPILIATEHWPIATGITQVGMSYLGFPSGSYETASVEMDGLNQSHYHDISLKEEPGADDIARINFNTDRAIAWRESGTETRSGWPSKRLKFHRMFEGPRHGKKYQDRGHKYIHLDIENDPSGSGGNDFSLKDIGVVTESDVAFQTCAVETKIEPWQIDITSTPSYPLTLPGDVSHELEGAKTDSTVAEFQAALTGNDRLYIRLNLLKEHFNDMVVMLDKCKSIRPLSFDQIYFGDAQPLPNVDGVFRSNIMPKDAYAAFLQGSSLHALFERLEVPILTRQNFANDVYTLSVQQDQNALESYRWVSIADVKNVAEKMGFVFRYEKQFFLLDVEIETQPGYPNLEIYNMDVFVPKASGNWKSPITKPILTGDDYFTEKTTYATDDNGNVTGHFHNNRNVPINFLNLVNQKTQLKSAIFESNRSILFYLYDTSKPDNDENLNPTVRAKLAIKQIDANGQVGSDVIRELTANEQTETVGAGQNVYFCQVTPPVTHSIEPVALESTANELLNTNVGLSWVVFKK
jgi:hypothetical protein